MYMNAVRNINPRVLSGSKYTKISLLWSLCLSLVPGCAVYDGVEGYLGLLLINSGTHSVTLSLSSFQLLAVDNGSLSADVNGSIDHANSTITIALPLSADFGALIPTFSSNAITVKVGGVVQNSGVSSQSFAVAPVYVLNADDGSSRSYQVVRTVDASIGLIHHWSFSGHANDSIGGITATVNGATLAANRQSQANQAYSFASDVNITMASAPVLSSSSSWSYCMWVRVDAFGVQTTSTGAGNGDFILDRTPENNPLVNIKISHTNRFVSMFRNDAGGGLTQLIGPIAATGVWTHLIFVRESGTQFRFYINANLEAASADSIGNLTVPIPVVGDHVSGASKFFSGSIDEIRFYNRVLTATEISNMYNYLD